MHHVAPSFLVQAQLVGARLAAERHARGLCVDRVFCSHANRARHTAEILCAAAQIKAPITTDERVIEFCAGSFEKSKRCEAYTTAVRAAMVAQGPFYRPPGHSPDGVRGESQLDVQVHMHSMPVVFCHISRHAFAHPAPS
jgi:broad specificity phosphatase PhoE